MKASVLRQNRDFLMKQRGRKWAAADARWAWEGVGAEMLGSWVWTLGKFSAGIGEIGCGWWRKKVIQSAGLSKAGQKRVWVAEGGGLENNEPSTASRSRGSQYWKTFFSVPVLSPAVRTSLPFAGGRENV